MKRRFVISLALVLTLLTGIGFTPTAGAGEANETTAFVAGDGPPALAQSQGGARANKQCPQAVAERSFQLAQTGIDKTKMESCLDCCAGFQSKCLKDRSQTGKCNVQYSNCVANCRSHGSSPANWTCWGR